MRSLSCLLLLCLLLLSCESKTLTGPAVTNADIELFDQAVYDFSSSINWQGRILNRSRYVVGVGVKLELTTPGDSTFYTSSEKFIEAGARTFTSFTYTEDTNQVPRPNLPSTWNWKMTSRVVTFR